LKHRHQLQESSRETPSEQVILDADTSTEFLGSYFSKLNWLDYDLLGFLPSLVATSVVFVARLALDPHTHPWL
jgi:hypothetical protein